MTSTITKEKLTFIEQYTRQVVQELFPPEELRLKLYADVADRLRDLLVIVTDIAKNWKYNEFTSIKYVSEALLSGEIELSYELERYIRRIFTITSYDIKDDPNDDDKVVLTYTPQQLLQKNNAITTVLRYVINLDQFFSSGIVLEAQAILNYFNENLPGYKFHYFTWINPTNQGFLAKTGQIPLNIDNFENYTSLFSLPLSENEQVSGDRDPATQAMKENNFKLANVYGWRKKDLIEAIKTTGLSLGIMQEHKYSWRKEFAMYRDDTERAQVFNDPDNVLKNRLDDDEQEMVNYAYGKLKYKDGIPYKTLLLRNWGRKPKFVVTKETRYEVLHRNYFYEMVYRRLFGTIYLINWQQFCQGPFSKLIIQEAYNNMLAIYFSIKTDQGSCAEIAANYINVQNIMVGLSNTPEQWLRLLLQQYAKELDFVSQSDKRGISPPQREPGQFQQ